MIKLLDLCCKAGGCSKGYEMAAQQLGMSIEITGVDIEPQPNYPFHFIQGDAVAFMRDHGHGYTHIHASPPCQFASPSTAFKRRQGKVYVNLVPDLKPLLYASLLPCVIENVPQAGIRPDLILNGAMFGDKVIRKRHFELVNWFMMNPISPVIRGTVRGGDYVSVFGSPKWENTGWSKKNAPGTKVKVKPIWRKRTVLETWKYAMGVEWMKTEEEVANAIPPSYTHYIGLELFKR